MYIEAFLVEHMKCAHTHFQENIGQSKCPSDYISGIMNRRKKSKVFLAVYSLCVCCDFWLQAWYLPAMPVQGWDTQTEQTHYRDHVLCLWRHSGTMNLTPWFGNHHSMVHFHGAEGCCHSMKLEKKISRFSRRSALTHHALRSCIYCTPPRMPKWRFRLGSQILQMLCHPGGDDCILGWG